MPSPSEKFRIVEQWQVPAIAVWGAALLVGLLLAYDNVRLRDENVALAEALERARTPQPRTRADWLCREIDRAPGRFICIDTARAM